jgi:uncharacterized protein
MLQETEENVEKQRKEATIMMIAGAISTLAAAGLVTLMLSLHPTFAAQDVPRPTLAAKKSPPTAEKNHRLAMQVNANDPAAMNLALNNASNVAEYYKELGEKVDIEIVAYGPGLHMLREDTSPVKERIKSISESIPSISFKACGNTQQNMRKAEAKDIPLVAQAQVVKSGVVRLMQLQEQGWSYIRP